MLRSLVAPNNLAEGEEFVLRRNLSLESLEEALADGEIMWIEVLDAESDEIAWLERVFNLHPAVVSDLGREDRRPTLLVYPEYLFLSLFEPRIQLRKITGDEIHCLIGEQFFVTVRKSNKSSVENAYERAAQNPEIWKRGVTYLLYLTSQFVVDAYYPLLDRISNDLNDMEESIMANGGKIQQKAVYATKQQLIALRQMVAPQREVLSAVIGEERLAKTSEDRELFRHLYERLLRIYDVIDSQRDLSNNVLDLIQSQDSAKVAEAVTRLTIISMLFLPPTFLIGLFGLNFITTEPELTIPLGGGWVFLFLNLAVIAVGAALVWFFRRRKWL